MTKQRARDVLANYRQPEPIRFDVNEVYEALDIAIVELEQELCEDCISRKQALAEIDRTVLCYTHQARQIIENLPSIQPKPKTGHWIEDENEMEVRCSECAEENDNCSKYCPNCGAKMEK